MKFYTPILSLPDALENYLLCESLLEYMPNNLLTIFLKLFDEVCIRQEYIGPSSVDYMRYFLKGVRRSMIKLISSNCPLVYDL